MGFSCNPLKYNKIKGAEFEKTQKSGLARISGHFLVFECLFILSGLCFFVMVI